MSLENNLKEKENKIVEIKENEINLIKINNEIDDIKPETPSKEKREKLQRKIEERKEKK